jgi:hypothetical protein
MADVRQPVVGAHRHVPWSVPMGQQRAQAFLAAPGHYTPPGLMPGQQQPLY